MAKIAERLQAVQSIECYRDVVHCVASPPLNDIAQTLREIAERERRAASESVTSGPYLDELVGLSDPNDTEVVRCLRRDCCLLHYSRLGGPTLLQRQGSQEEFGAGIRRIASHKPRRPKRRLGHPASHESEPIHEMMWAGYGEYLASLGGDAYRDKVFAYVDKDDSPRPVTYQLDLLRQVGFSTVELLHKNGCFAAFGAVK